MEMSHHNNTAEDTTTAAARIFSFLGGECFFHVTPRDSLDPHHGFAAHHLPSALGIGHFGRREREREIIGGLFDSFCGQVN